MGRRLEAAGRMAPAGARLVAEARAGGAWNRLDEVEALIVPDDLATAFDRHPGARTHWDAFPGRPAGRRWNG
ncbi:YdeI/OmpD-associated family protein [Micromonospora kangleipakensis]|uniref:YdeI/OmpD-associated family protein n=1 Tax=Micromonospora kangleipakensis TaxID=1077942 RepID=UPI002414D76C|nr:YdeI/OmpD-associated family protein [Micromonospora kangleipakensis]